jgi:hypothetical protein
MASSVSVPIGFGMRIGGSQDDTGETSYNAPGVEDVGGAIGSTWDDYTGVTAADAHERAVQAQIESEERRAREAQLFFKRQSEQGMTDIMGGAQMGSQAIYDYGGLAAGALGESADAALQAMMSGRAGLSNFQADPGYQFRLQQGEDAINRAASARGGRLSGRTLQELSDYNQGLASQEFGNVANREMDYARAMAGLYGQSGAQMAGLFGGMGSQLGSIYTNVGPSMSNIGIGVGAHNTGLQSGLNTTGRWGTDSAGTSETLRGQGTRDLVNAGAGAVYDWATSD